MAESSTENLRLLKHIEDLGEGTQFASRIFDLVGQSPFFAEFEREDIDVLSDYMHVFRAEPGQSIIREGDDGDFMLMILSGAVDIYKNSPEGERQLMTTVSPGHTLGEMSMIDGEPRFATCEASDTVTFAVLTRDSMANIILEKPSLGAKILIKLVTLLSQRLRHTSAQLLKVMGRARML